MTQSTRMVKKETLLIAICISLATGFVAGVVFSAYQSTHNPLLAGGPAKAPMMPPAATAPSASPEQGAQILALEKDAAQNPRDAKTWIRLGDLYFDTHNAAKAIAAYEKALAIAPDNADVWTDLGVMYRRSGDPKKAVASFDRAIAVNPAHEVSRFNKGIVLLHDLNDPKSAIAVWESLVAINPAARAPSGQLVGELVQNLKKSLAAGHAE